MTRFLALIPARGGSKGVPNKNMREMGGLPLIGHTIAAARGASCTPRIWVSTDSPAIAEYATRLGVVTDDLRPEVLSGDSALTADVVRYELTRFAAKGDLFDYVMLLQPTTPFRTAQHIDEAVACFLASSSPSLISVCEVGGNHPDCMYRLRGSLLEKLTPIKAGTRRQMLETLYLRNGSIYLTSIRHFEHTGQLVSDNPACYVMTRRCSINIDEPEDLLFAETLLNHGH